MFTKKAVPAPVPPVPQSSPNTTMGDTLLKIAGVVIAGVLVKAFAGGKYATRKQCHHDKKLRNGLSEKQVDKMIMDSFPASDPASTY